MTQSHAQGKLEDVDFAFGFGFRVNTEARHLTELGSIGSYEGGGFFYTKFLIDPKEDMIAIFMGQLHPTGGLDLDEKETRLPYQALKN
jgi:CubicO group peptidase (beta-lactamase class C family)